VRRIKLGHVAAVEQGDMLALQVTVKALFDGDLVEETLPEFLKRRFVVMMVGNLEGVDALEGDVSGVVDECFSAPENIDNTLLWMLVMSDENNVEDYIDNFRKMKFREIIPVSDLADLLIYFSREKKVKGNDTPGFDFLLEYQHDGVDEFDHFCVTNVLLYIQKSKEVQMEF
jgi:hypothetical protein